MFIKEPHLSQFQRLFSRLRRYNPPVERSDSFPWLCETSNTLDFEVYLLVGVIHNFVWGVIDVNTLHDGGSHSVLIAGARRASDFFFH